MTRLAIVLTQGFADWECAPLMGAAAGHLGIHCIVASPSRSVVTSMGGLRVLPAWDIDDLRSIDFDGVVIVGGTSWGTQSAPDLSRVLLSFRNAGRMIAGICGGTLPLAAAGLLDDIAHTSNARSFLERAPEYRGQDNYRDLVSAVVDKHIVTAPGTAPITFMAEVLRAVGHGSGELDAFLDAFAAEHGFSPCSTSRG